MSSNLKETKSLAFLMTEGSVFFSLKRKGLRYDSERFISYRTLLNPNTGRALVYLSRCCIKSINSFSRILRK